MPIATTPVVEAARTTTNRLSSVRKAGVVQPASASAAAAAAAQKKRRASLPCSRAGRAPWLTVDMASGVLCQGSGFGMSHVAGDRLRGGVGRVPHANHSPLIKGREAIGEADHLLR